MTKFISIDNQNNIKPLKLRHQSFSDTDTCKTSGKLGVVYPFDIDEDINNFVVASSIIDHSNDNSHLLKHTEVRIADKVDDTLEYQLIDNTVGVVLLNDDNYNKALDTYFKANTFKESKYCEINNNYDIINIDCNLEQIYRNSNTEVIISDKNISRKQYKKNIIDEDMNSFIELYKGDFLDV